MRLNPKPQTFGILDYPAKFSKRKMMVKTVTESYQLIERGEGYEVETGRAFAKARNIGNELKTH
jgi:hypothetical protein